MNEYSFYGPFSKELQEFIEVKQAIGYKYLKGTSILRRFDGLTAERHPLADTLTKEIVLDWCEKKSYEAQGNLYARYVIIRQFALYLTSLGQKAYIIPKNYFSPGKKYIPYIFTDNELKKFFGETRRCKYLPWCPHRQLVMPLLFRMLYTCGLRVSEARLLKVGDVDLRNGVLTINRSKNDNSRLVPMSDAITEECRIYSSKVHIGSSLSDYYFPIRDNKPCSAAVIYNNFRRLLWNAGISHKGKGKGPRVHDFRHSFAVHCLRKWCREEKDLMVYLPALQVYLGHASFSGTSYYLRLTADVYPDITLKLETAYSELVPLLEEENYENK